MNYSSPNMSNHILKELALSTAVLSHSYINVSVKINLNTAEYILYNSVLPSLLKLVSGVHILQDI